jgi:hypothetical protein
MNLLSTAQQWRIERWVITERFLCSDCHVVSTREGDKIWISEEAAI